MSEERYLYCYTIGHSTHPIEYFIKLLKLNKIDCLLDVRSSPYSKVAPQYNKENLKKILKEHEIIYGFLGKELGARYSNPDLLYSDGKVCFAKVRATKDFINGITRVINGAFDSYNIALMCSEKNPLYCHRFVLISYQLVKEGIEVRHILEDGSFITNEELEKKLLSLYINNYKTILEILNNPETGRNTLEEAYERRNKEIAYSENIENIEEEKL